jgi:hypothetical protein
MPQPHQHGCQMLIGALFYNSWNIFVPNKFDFSPLDLKAA